MAAVADGIVDVDETFEEVIGFCLGCRACETVCPALVPYGRALEGTRAEIAAQIPSNERKVRHVLIGRLLAMRPALRVATIGAALAQRVWIDRVAPGPLARMRGLRRLPITARSIVGRRSEPSGPTRGTVALLAGCVMDPWFGAVHEATITVLTMAGYRVEVPESQTCCGALSAHDGAAAAAERLAEQNAEAFTGYDLVIANAAGCSAHLKGYDHWTDTGIEVATKARDVTEVVADLIEADVLPTLAPNGVRVAIQDPCHLRHGQKIIDAPRRIVAAAGFEPVEIDPAAMCCGAAGIYMVLYPETSDELGRRKAEQIGASGATIVASANPGCEMQLRSHLARSYRVVHPIELYHDELQRTERLPSTYSRL